MTATPGWAGSSLRELRRGLHVVESRVDEFDVRCAVIVGTERALVWDTLAHPEQLRSVPALLEGRTGVIAYSHADWDHVWGAAALPSVEEVVAHERCAERFRHEVPEELARRRAVEPGRWTGVRIRAPTHTFRETWAADLGGVSVLLMHLPGHTADCSVAWIPEWGALLAGDAVETPVPLLNHGGTVPEWLEGLRRWEGEENLTLVVPAHGRVGGREVLSECREYLETLAQGGTLRRLRELPAFYRRAHEENLRLMRGDGGREATDPDARNGA